MGNEVLVKAARVEPTWLQVKSPRDKRVLGALQQVDRRKFLPMSHKQFAYMDRPVPIGHDATCSMPSLVALMADLLELQEGQNVLEVGTGCGYSAAVAKHLVGYGRLTTIEIVSELYEMGKANLKRHFGNLDGVEVVLGDGSVGFPANGPYDRIYLTAAPRAETFQLPPLVTQLKVGGVLLFPELQTGDLVRLVKSAGESVTWGAWKRVVSFVPLLGKNA
jgi:protein-L-isoaspartate(D-aspartate) O-methyltransferase